MQSHNVDYVEKYYLCGGMIIFHVIKVSHLILTILIFVMYYLMSIEVLGTTAPNNVLIKSLFSDYEVFISENELCEILDKSKRFLRRELGNYLYCVFSSHDSILYFITPIFYKEFGFRPSLFTNLKNKFDLSRKFYKFLVRYIHDSDKAIASVAAVDKFICDIEAGASPVSLWSNYCWYRVFGHMPINFIESDLNSSAAF